MLSVTTSRARTKLSSLLRHDRRHDEREHGGRKDSASSSHVEADERYAPGLERLRQQQPGDQEAGEDEEDVDADVTALQKGIPACPSATSRTATARRPWMSDLCRTIRTYDGRVHAP
jgi:hypothetical protein